MISTFHKCLVPLKRVRVAGYVLPPLSLWSVFLMRAGGSPYVNGGPCSILELLFALECCLKRYGCDPWILRGIMRVFFFRFRCAVRIKAAFSASHDRMVQHLDRHFEIPEKWAAEKSGEGGGGVRAPWELHMVHVLCKEYRCSLAEAWNMRIDMAKALIDVVSESYGDTSLVNDDEHEKIMRVKGGAAS